MQAEERRQGSALTQGQYGFEGTVIRHLVQPGGQRGDRRACGYGPEGQVGPQRRPDPGDQAGGGERAPAQVEEVVLQPHLGHPAAVPGHSGADPRGGLMSMRGFPEEVHRYLLGTMLNADGEDHLRLRRLVSRAFTARRISELRPRVEQITDELLSELPGRAEDGVVDLIEHLASPLSITVICELVGIPEADRGKWLEWGPTWCRANHEHLLREQLTLTQRLRRDALQGFLTPET